MNMVEEGKTYQEQLVLCSLPEVLFNRLEALLLNLEPELPSAAHAHILPVLTRPLSHKLLGIMSLH